MIEIIILAICFFISFFFLNFLLNWNKDVPHPDETSYSKIKEKCCVSISSPGGFDKLNIIPISAPTKGPNVPHPFDEDGKLLPGFAIIKTHAVGVNDADVSLRWGSSESANKYAGYPITPGFEFSGTILNIFPHLSTFAVGDKVFGITMFGGYSSLIVVPESQIFTIPKDMNMSQAAGFLTNGLTAYYAIYELFKFKSTEFKINRVMVHSALGGVERMIIQMVKMEGGIVVGVVGESEEYEMAKQLGCDHVINRSKENLWSSAKKIFKPGFNVIFDSNGVETFQKNFDHLAPEGKLIIYGFPSIASHFKSFSIFKWIQSIISYFKTPKFDPMKLRSQNKSIMGFNLSFLFSRKDLIREGIQNLIKWYEEGKIKPPQITEFKFWEVGLAHQHLQSGNNTMGKIVLVFD